MHPSIGTGCAHASRLPSGVKVRRTRIGVHIFDVATGLNVLLDEVSVDPREWDQAPRQVSMPFVIRVEGVVTAEGRTRYVAVERFRFLALFRGDNPIQVTMRVDPDQQRITQDVISPGGVRLKSTVELHESREDTTVDELIEMSSPRLLRPYVLRQARAAQLYRAGELARRLG